MNDWIIIWLSLMGISLIVEIITTEFVSIWFIPGSLVGIILAALGVNGAVQVFAVIIVSVGSLFAFRPIAMRLVGKGIRTNADSLIGRRTRLLTAVDADVRGTVKFGDVVWYVSSKSDLPIEAGKYVEILEIEGNKLIVKEI